MRAEVPELARSLKHLRAAGVGGWGGAARRDTPLTCSSICCQVCSMNRTLHFSKCVQTLGVNTSFYETVHFLSVEQ